MVWSESPCVGRWRLGFDESPFVRLLISSCPRARRQKTRGEDKAATRVTVDSSGGVVCPARDCRGHVFPKGPRVHGSSREKSGMRWLSRPVNQDIGTYVVPLGREGATNPGRLSQILFDNSSTCIWPMRLARRWSTIGPSNVGFEQVQRMQSAPVACWYLSREMVHIDCAQEHDSVARPQRKWVLVDNNLMMTNRVRAPPCSFLARSEVASAVSSFHRSCPHLHYTLTLSQERRWIIQDAFVPAEHLHT